MKSLILRSFLALAAALCTACDGGREGERCNPNLSHDECNAGLSCQQTTACGESYCCPAAATSSSNPYCNGQGNGNNGYAACPTPDAGAEDAGASDASSD